MLINLTCVNFWLFTLICSITSFFVNEVSHQYIKCFLLCVTHSSYLIIVDLILLIEWPFFSNIYQSVDSYLCNFTGISSWSNPFYFFIHYMLLSWYCNITWPLQWVQVLHCSSQIQFSSSHSDFSHFAITSRIYFCYDFEFPLHLLSFLFWQPLSLLSPLILLLLLYFK